MNASDRAISYRRRGWFPIPIPTRSKIPPVTGWQLLRLGPDEIPKYFPGTMNIGILTGAVSSHLVDIDLDTQSSIRLAPRFLPTTTMFGRKSKPLSHWVYTAYGARTEVFSSPKTINGEKVKTTTLLELRADGKQTVFPNSIHETGEFIEWAINIEEQQPAQIKAEELRRAVAKLATACLLVQFGWTDEDAISYTQQPSPTALGALPTEVQAYVARWLGVPPPRVTTNEGTTKKPNLDKSYEIAVERWNAENPINFEKRNTGRCPVCKDSRSFGQLFDNPNRWSCFSTDHPDDVGIRSPRGDCFLGDSLDLEAFKRGKTRTQVLRDVGYLQPYLQIVRPDNAPPLTDADAPLLSDEDGDVDAGPDDAPPTDNDDPRPHILMSPEVHEVVDQAISALVSDTELYQRGGHLVRVTATIRSPMHTKIFGPTPSIEPIPSATLTETITRAAKVFKYDGRKKDYVHTIPPPVLVQGVLGRGNWRGIRPLEGIVEVPTMRIDGSVLDTPGYDEGTGLIYQPAIGFEPVMQNPTREDARKAIDDLLDIVCDFPFAAPSPLYKSAWLAALLTPFVRTSIPTAPMFLIDSNIRGSGKSKLCDAISIIATGRPMPRTVNPPHDEEFKKLVTSLAIAGASLVMIDNITGVLGSQALDAALTAATWKDRILGTSEVTKEIPLTTIWFGTGNNVELRGDLCRRTIHIRLKTNDEQPEQRDAFKHRDLLEYVQGNRSKFVSAALTVLRAYVAAGSPPQVMKAMDFREWSNVVRATLIWAGMRDPAETQGELAQGDGDRVALGLFLDAIEVCPELLTATRLSVSAMLRFASAGTQEADALREAVGELCPTRDNRPPSAVSLGKRLGALRGRMVNGRCIDKVTEDNNGTIWKIIYRKDDDNRGGE